MVDGAGNVVFTGGSVDQFIQGNVYSGKLRFIRGHISLNMYYHNRHWIRENVSTNDWNVTFTS
jgi:hypothetical protein